MSQATNAVQKNPFPGLRPFREEEEYLFFGRESQVDAMVNKLAANRFLAVVGNSGSGKSSLVNCGLRPALHGGLMARAGTAWRMAQFRPGSDPLRAMAHALAQDGVLFRDYQAEGLTLAEIVDTTLRMSKLGLIDIYEQAQLGEDVNLLVVVDQFEELFRYRQLGASQQENVYGVSEAATAFVNLLLEAEAQMTYPIYVVLTMRSDFLGDCTQFPGLAEAINAGQYLVPRMTRDERRAAISGPIGVGGAVISPVLLTRLVNDVGDNPDQLSILQHALNRTWARWQHEGGKGPLELLHYEAIGTMAHALDQHAERAYAELDSMRHQQICEKLFKALTDKATDPRGVRRPTTLGTLCALADGTAAEVTEVIDVFRKPSRSFLMPPAGDALETETVIDISHESLMRVWQRLITWADEEALSAQTYCRLAETAVLHAAGKASLWRNPDLQLALDWSEKEMPTAVWAGRYKSGFDAAMGFLKESRRAFEAEETAREDQRRRQLRNTRIFSAVLGVAFLLAFGLGIWAWRQSDEAKEQTKKALQALRVALAWEYTEKDPIISVAFLREAEHPASIRGWRGATGKVLQMLGASSRLPLLGHSAAIFSAEFSPDGTRVVTASRDNTARLWDAVTGKQLYVFRHEDAVTTASFSPDARLVYTASLDNTARFWDAATGQIIVTLRHDDSVTSISSSPDGRLFLTTSEGAARLWEPLTGKLIAKMETGGLVDYAMISPDGLSILTVSQYEATLWDSRSFEKRANLSDNNRILSARYSPDGARIITASDDNTARVRDAASGKPIGLALLHEGGVTSAAISPDGTRIVTGSLDHTAALWDAATGQPIARLMHKGPVWTASFSPDGRYVATTSEDGNARLWTLDGLLDSVFDVSKNGLNSANYSPDGSKLVAVSRDGVAEILALLPEIESLQEQLWKQKVNCPDARTRIALLGQSEAEAEHDYQACQKQTEKLIKH